MSVTSLGVFAIVVPTDSSPSGDRPRVVDETYGYALRASSLVRSLSENNPRNYDLLQGLLYTPQLPDDSPCSNATRALIPANVTTFAEVSMADYARVGIAPWTESACVHAYLEQMRNDQVRAALFFRDDGSSDRPPGSSDEVWRIDANEEWKSNNPFPVAAIPGLIGTHLLSQLALYSGNMSSAPYGDILTQLYDPEEDVRLYARMNVESGNGIPSLWVFLIIVLAILLAVVLTTSFVMHVVQRRQRRNLQRRIAAGEVDLEILGIKRMNVPEDILSKMPQYTFTGPPQSPIGNNGAARAADADVEASPTDTTAVAAVAATTAVVAAGAKAPQFSQQTCPICLDDFASGETTVRELPCLHIFHPECIDPFLKENSSLCPLCKKSALPQGYCPIEVTNLMVRRERLMRRLRERNRSLAAAQANPPPTADRSGEPSRGELAITGIANRIRRFSTMAGGHGGSGGANGAGSEMQNLRVIPEEQPPPEIAAQGAAARREWRRQRVAARQEEGFNQEASEARRVDVERPLWRRIAGRVHPRWE